MSAKMSMVVSAALVIAVLAVIVVVEIRTMFTPTTGARIAAYARPRKAHKVTIVKDAVMARKDMAGVLRRYDQEGIPSATAAGIGNM